MTCSQSCWRNASNCFILIVTCPPPCESYKDTRHLPGSLGLCNCWGMRASRPPRQYPWEPRCKALWMVKNRRIMPPKQPPQMEQWTELLWDCIPMSLPLSHRGPLWMCLPTLQLLGLPMTLLDTSHQLSVLCLKYWPLTFNMHDLTAKRWSSNISTFSWLLTTNKSDSPLLIHM